MATIDDMLIVIDAQTERMRRELRRTDGQVANFERRTNKRLALVDKGFAGLGRSVALLTRNLGLLTGVGLAGGIAGMGGRTDAALQNADALEDTAEKLGLSVERLQELRFAAQETGVPIGTLDTALQRFTRRLGEAAQGKGELTDVLEQYNIQLTDSRGRTRETVDVLGDLAEAVRGAESQQEALRVAFKAFDSEGAALVTLLRQGREGIDRFGKQAHDLGIVLDRDTVSSLAETNKELERLNKQIEANRARIAANITPIRLWGTAFVANVTDKIREAIEALPELERRFRDYVQAGTGRPLPPGTIFGGEQRSNAAAKGDRLDLESRVKGQTAAIGKWTTTVKRAGDQADDFAKRTARLGRVGESVASNLDRSFAEFQRTGTASMKGFVDSAIRDLTRLFVRQAIIQPLIGAATGGLGFGIPMGPARQRGGPVSAGRAHPVGERGPELFVPRVAGQIVPAGGGGLNVTVINNAGARVETRQTRQANGGRGLEIVVDEITAGNVRRAGSASALALQQAGARSPLVQR